MLVRGMDFPYVHDLARLMSTLEDAGEAIPDAIRRAATLTRFAVQARYPSLDEPVSEQEYHEAVEVASAVVRWAEGRL